jgi:stage V sporulation protein G
MQITEVRIQIIKAPRNKLMAFASLTLDDALVIKDFQIFSAPNGCFVGMPSRKMPDGTWRETVFAISTELSEQITQAKDGQVSSSRTASASTHDNEYEHDF